MTDDYRTFSKDPWQLLGLGAHNITLEPTGLTGKHFAKTKSKMLTSKARGSAWRWADDAATLTCQL